MTVRPSSRRYYRLIVENDKRASAGVGAALQMIIDAQRRWLETVWRHRGEGILDARSRRTALNSREHGSPNDEVHSAEARSAKIYGCYE
jgi:hypothetical protein